MISWITGRFSSTILAYASVGLLSAFVLSTVTLGFTARAYVGAKADVKAEIEKCNTKITKSVADAERVARVAVQKAADKRLRTMQEQMRRSEAATLNERTKRLEAERTAKERDKALADLAKEAFDEDDLPDSNAALNVFLTSHALRCVLHAGDNRPTSAGGSGGTGVCGDPGSPDGVHPGFSNVTYGDALRYWGADRDAAIRLNQRLASIRDIQGDVISENSED